MTKTNNYKEIRMDLNKKKNNNSVLTSLNFLDKDIGNGIVLDGPSNKTAKTLVDGGINKNQIYIPEINSKTHSFHKWNNLCIPFKGSVEQFIKDCDKEVLENVNWTYLDYMGIVHGSKTKGTYPLNDCLKILRKTKKNKVSMNMVFCVQKRLARFFKNKDTILEETQYEIENMFRKSDFIIVRCCEPRKYRSRRVEMGFFSYCLERNNTK